MKGSAVRIRASALSICSGFLQERVSAVACLVTEGSSRGSDDACGRPWFVDLPNRAWLGENIASGYTSARAVFNGWIESPRHRANIMRRQFRRVGFAKVGLFYVAEFSS